MTEHYPAPGDPDDPSVADTPPISPDPESAGEPTTTTTANEPFGAQLPADDPADVGEPGGTWSAEPTETPVGEPTAEIRGDEVLGAATPPGASASAERDIDGTEPTTEIAPAGTRGEAAAGESLVGESLVGESWPAAGGASAHAAPAGAEPTVDASVGDAATEQIPLAGGATGGTAGGDVPPAGSGGATAAGFPAGGVPPSSGPWGGFTGRRLARSSQRKVIAGVAGGLGEYTGIDPVLFRVLFAVLTLFGGSGILLYVVGWLFMPAEDEPSSPVESLLHRGPSGSNRARDAAAAAALVIAGLVLASVLALGDARDLALVLVVVGGAFFLVRNLQERREGGPPQPALSQPPPPPPAPYETPLPTYQPPPAYQPPPPVQHTVPTVTLPPPPAPAPAPRREHSALGLITICLMLVVLGVAAALTASGAIAPEPDDLLAVAVGTIGAGLLVGAWFGRARWLTWLGIPLLIALIVVSASNVSLKGGVGDRQYNPQTAAQVEPEYRVGVGSIRLDLSDVDLSKQPVRTRVSAGVGNIEVIVPRSANVSIDGRAGIGEVDLLGQVSNGTSATRTVVDHGPGGDASTDLTLDLDVSIGQVEVDRAAA